MQNILAAVAVSAFLMLTFGPAQLQGLPGHLRTHDGVMAENEETERAVVEALLALARSQVDKTTANEQQIQKKVATNEQYPYQKQVATNEQYPYQKQVATNQYFPIYQKQVATNEQYPQQNQVATNEQYHQQTSNKNAAEQQNRTALMMQYVVNKMMKDRQTLARNQRIENRRRQSAKSQQWIPITGEENALAQQSPSGITIEYCGAVGDIIQNALRFGLGFIPGGDSAYGVYIACAEQPTYPCTTVTVAVPAGDIKADIDVCDYGKPIDS